MYRDVTAWSFTQWLLKQSGVVGFQGTRNKLNVFARFVRAYCPGATLDLDRGCILFVEQTRKQTCHLSTWVLEFNRRLAYSPEPVKRDQALRVLDEIFARKDTYIGSQVS